MTEDFIHTSNPYTPNTLLSPTVPLPSPRCHTLFKDSHEVNHIDKALSVCLGLSSNEKH